MVASIASNFRFLHGVLWILQAWNTKRARETVALGRELLGGNGILADFLVAKVSYLQRCENLPNLTQSRSAMIQNCRLGSKLCLQVTVTY